MLNDRRFLAAFFAVLALLVAAAVAAPVALWQLLRVVGRCV